MARKYTAYQMRVASKSCEEMGHSMVSAMLRQAADTYEKIEGEIKRLEDLLVPTCRNCGHRCAFRNGKTHCEKHIGDGSEVEFVANIKYLRELIHE